MERVDCWLTQPTSNLQEVHLSAPSMFVQDLDIQLFDDGFDEVGVGIIGGRPLVPEPVIHVSGSTVLKLVRVEEDDVEFAEGVNQGTSQEGPKAEGGEIVEGVHYLTATPSRVDLYSRQGSVSKVASWTARIAQDPAQMP